MIRVIILRGTVGPDGPLEVGDDVELDDRSARLLLAIGKARLVGKEISTRDPEAVHRDPVVHHEAKHHEAPRSKRKR